MLVNVPLNFSPPKVIGVEDPDIDPEGHVPLPLLDKGIDVVVPLWPDYATSPDDRDLLTVYFQFFGQAVVEIERIITSADIEPEFIIHIDPIHLQQNGVAELWYQVLDSADNPSLSERRNLTIDRSLPSELAEPVFLNLNLHGYLNCDTKPPIWDGVEVQVPPLIGFEAGDRIRLLWKAYPSSLNGSGVENTRARKLFSERLLSDDDIREGYFEVIQPYDVHLAPLINNASGTLQYRIYRGRRIVGVSKFALARVDRIKPGAPLPCGPEFMHAASYLLAVGGCRYCGALNNLKNTETDMNAIVKKGDLSRQAALRVRTTPPDSVDADPPMAPSFPAQILPGGDLRIPVADLGADLDYLVPQPLIEHEDDAFQPQIRRKGTTTWLFILPGGPDDFIFPGPVAGRDWSVPYKIPQRFLTEELTPETPTEWEFMYVYYAGGTNDAGSVIATFAVDRTRPYVVKNPPSDRTPGAAAWPADLGPTVPIDDAYLDGKTHIVVRPPIPANYEDTDVYSFYFSPAPDPARDTPVYNAVLSPARDAAIPVSVFLNAPDGPNQLIFISRDLAGNVSRRSNFSQRNVVHAKDPDPSTVQPPIVTLASGADGDRLIDLADTQFDTRGVEFKVRVPTPNSPSDTIVGLWGGRQVGPEQRVGSSTELTFYAPYDDVKAVYGDTDGIVPTVVSFKMFRGVRELATANTIIEVDISFIGPDPITIGLDAPRLTTTSGSVDEIKEADYKDEGIKALIDLFDDPPTEEGWLIDLFYADIQIGDPIALTTGQEGTTIERNIPWDIIARQGSGDKVLSYTLYTPAGVNPSHSRLKTIAVEPFPVEMAAPVVQGLAGPRRRIGCATLNFPTATIPGDGTARRNLLVRILPNTYTVDGEEITVKYAAYNKATPPVLIPGTDAEARLTITGAVPPEGILIGIGTWDEEFKPAHGGDARVTYSISRGGPGVNPTPDSLPATHEVDVVYSEGQYCDEYVPTP